MLRVFLSIFATLLSLLVSTTSLKADGHEELRVAIFSKMDDPTLDAFYHALALANPDINPDVRPSGLDDTDALVFFLDRWQDVDYAPGAKELSEIFDKVRANRPDAVSQMFVASRQDGREIRFLFYSLSSTGYLSLACYAREVAAVLNDEPGVLTSGSCR